jgi:hypothetical protein
MAPTCHLGLALGMDSGASYLLDRESADDVRDRCVTVGRIPENRGVQLNLDRRLPLLTSPVEAEIDRYLRKPAEHDSLLPSQRTVRLPTQVEEKGCWLQE